MRIRLKISYDGNDFWGWQTQNNGDCPSVQQTLEMSLGRLFNQKVSAVASGRTDIGVHALAQVVHFDAPKMPPTPDITYALNQLTPKGLVIKQAWEAPPEFHAQFSARAKTYVYRIYNAPRPSALLAKYALWVRPSLDLEFLNRCSKFIEGKQDFKSFQNVGTVVTSTVRTVHRAQWQRVSPRLIEFRVTGSGFLKQMVRNLVGTQLDLHLKGGKPEDMAQILAARDRKIAGVTARPEGLYLYRVYYPVDLDKRCRKI